MKKILIIITIFVISIVSIVFMKYTEYTKNQRKILNINKEFLIYENSTVQINNIVTLMNKAIAKNTENNIKQDEKKVFNENDTNSTFECFVFISLSNVDTLTNVFPATSSITCAYTWLLLLYTHSLGLSAVPDILFLTLLCLLALSNFLSVLFIILNYSFP
jgi:hypothetical protein